jgi:hypothetical protein
MGGKLIKILAAVAFVAAFWGVYIAGYRHGSRDALNWNFSAFIGGKFVPVGHGSTLLRSRLELKPIRNRNLVAETFSAPISPR